MADTKGLSRGDVIPVCVCLGENTFGVLHFCLVLSEYGVMGQNQHLTLQGEPSPVGLCHPLPSTRDAELVIGRNSIEANTCLVPGTGANSHPP